ncbi:MAG: polysaccharide biosynthesis/export family protein [Bacteroidetes bacterium]|nr:polysaccharide biosynthesis/export family protein [Bacteroidota bacterium]
MKKLLPLFILSILLTSCNINPSVMFKVPKDYQYSNDQTIGNIEYRISPNDIIGFNVYTNDGFKLVDLTTSAVSATSPMSNNPGTNQTQFLVEPDGQIKLPIIGKIKISGFTVREAEKVLEQQYATFYNKPFVMIRVLNRRVMVFLGTGGTGRTVSLDNENMHLVEALALAGGITTTGKAYKIKLIRGDLRNPKVMLIDLSTVEGMQNSNLLLQANDIIYVEPVPRYSQEILQQIAPIVGIITSLALVYQIVEGFNNN